MSHAEKCPICNGAGKIFEPLCPDNTPASPYVKTCHGCGGLGWITVQDNTMTMPSYLDNKTQ
jgi:hypothetical protein